MDFSEFENASRSWAGVVITPIPSYKRVMTLQSVSYRMMMRRGCVQVCGSNPGYGATVVALLLSAITILKEGDKMPSTGGVVTTAVAFHNTTLIDKLNDNKVTFEIVDTNVTK